MICRSKCVTMHVCLGTLTYESSMNSSSSMQIYKIPEAMINTILL